jgi:hypothetical protein
MSFFGLLLSISSIIISFFHQGFLAFLKPEFKFVLACPVLRLSGTVGPITLIFFHYKVKQNA